MTEHEQQAHIVLCDLNEYDYQTMLYQYGIPPEVASGRLGDRENEVSRILQFMRARRCQETRPTLTTSGFRFLAPS